MTGLPADVEKARVALGYPEIWLTSGILSHGLLLRQYALWLEGQEPTGTYRYAAIKLLLSEIRGLEDADIMQYVALALADPDPSLRHRALADLLQWPFLQTAQLQRLLADPAFVARELQAIGRRMILIRRLETATIAPLLFAECLRSDDLQVHLALLGHKGLSREQLSTLAGRGASPRLRNLARQLMLRR